ncbi:bifunctional riboflavin kinase/FAD synthetase [Thermopetrobacter sp. TC1]|uniref:bifunctional riboflavin kinase/FAD synthetase n=1 Tax=Thermopetrobacter sp. TC1 TaxID=1495045 RepID=UPI0005708153|nr:bifunctional riboflavin kinase/FAD synthetase [Thermopetrobacter sp. TC1]
MSRIVLLDREIPQTVRGGVVAIGNFDGVHRGHQQLLETARRIAEQENIPWGMMTLEPHPRDVFRPDEPLFRLTPLPMKARLLSGLGGDFVAVLPFSRTTAALEAEDFVRQYVVETLGARHVVTGYDFHFGHGRKGNPDLMRRLGEKHGFGVDIVDQVTDDDGIAPFSSSAIRNHLRRGHVKRAAHELGYWWMVEGEVVHGDARGREIGFPTVNIRLDPGCEPREGIYAMRVRPADGRMDDLPPMPHPSGWFGAGYVGSRPTFDGHSRFLEVFLLDFSADLYGRRLVVDFIAFIRGDEKFCSVDELIDRMNADVAEIRTILNKLIDDDPMTAFPLGALQHQGRL